MAHADDMRAARRDAGPNRHATVLAALAAVAAFMLLHWADGVSGIDNARGDNDSLLRLVQVRDLMGGQGWFDLHQYRMGPEGGFEMHWSRLVDLPIALIISAAEFVTGDIAAAERFALAAWPVLLFAAAICLLVACARTLAGDVAILPATIIGAAALHFVNVFSPGAIDHHNLQLVLALAMIHFLIRRPARAGAGIAAGAAAGLMIAVGMETLPLMAAGGVAAALSWAFDPAGCRRLAAGFGAGLALAALAAFLVTVPAGRWSVPACDAFSVPQMLVAAVSGFGLAALAAVGRLDAGPAQRIAGLAVLGAVTGGIVLALYPQCLSDPYASLDPMLRTYWLSAVTEAQSAARLVAAKPSMAVAYYATPLLALALACLHLVRRGPSRAVLVCGGVLLVAFLVSLWQVRGAVFSIPVAAIVLSSWVADLRAAAAGGGGRLAVPAMAAAWLLSLNVVWSGAAGAVAGLAGKGDAASRAAAAPSCYSPADFRPLAGLPPGGVLASSNLGAGILRNTHHRVLAGPYHRNVEGNLAALSALMGTPQEARALMLRHQIALVAVCPGNTESGAIAGWAPEGLMAMLLRGDVPEWLVRIPQDDGDAMLVFRVRD